MEGNRIASCTHAYQVHSPQPGYAEQSPAAYLFTSQSVCRDLASQARPNAVEIVAVSFSTQTPTLYFAMTICSL